MTKEELKQEVDRVKFEISKIEYVSDNPVLYNELHILLNKLNIMYEVISNPMVATSEEIDIYEENKGMKAYIYHITLHNDTKPIGYIRVSYDNKESIYGKSIFKSIRFTESFVSFGLSFLFFLCSTSAKIHFLHSGKTPIAYFLSV